MRGRSSCSQGNGGISIFHSCTAGIIVLGEKLETLIQQSYFSFHSQTERVSMSISLKSPIMARTMQIKVKISKLIIERKSSVSKWGLKVIFILVLICKSVQTIGHVWDYKYNTLPFHPKYNTYLGCFPPFHVYEGNYRNSEFENRIMNYILQRTNIF